MASRVYPLNLLKIIFIFYLSFAPVKSDCNLKISNESKQIPKFKKKFGSKWVEISSTPFINIKEHETLSGFCATTFRGISDNFDCYNYPCYMDYNLINFDKNRYLEFDCLDNKLGILKGSDRFTVHADPMYVECKDPQLHMYEMVAPLSICENSIDSYGWTTGTSENIIVAGACVDIESMTLESIYYSVGPSNGAADSNELNLNTPQYLVDKLLGFEIKNFELRFPYNNTPLAEAYSYEHEYYKKPDSQYDWMQSTYYSESLLAGHVVTEYFTQYKSLFNIPWWSNLLFGNWKQYTQALVDISDEYTYNIIAGFSGEVAKPSKYEECSQKKTIVWKTLNRERKAPLYIWNYIQSNYTNEEFVVIGYNSPFFDFYNEEDIVFCKDICDQISWLKSAHKTFRYSALGVIFCCSVKDVQSADVLNGFPTDISMKTLTSSEILLSSPQPASEPTQIDNSETYENEPTSESTQIDNSETYENEY